MFLGGAVLWAGYTLVWWGWEALTDHIPGGPDNTFHWPSIRDLIVPGRMAFAVPPRVNAPVSGTQAVAGGTAGQPLAGSSAAIAAQGGQDPNAVIGSQPIPPNDTFLNPVIQG